MALRAFLSLLPALSLVTAAPSVEPYQLSKRCVNSADDRSCWGDYDLSTNYYDEAPFTNVTREYWFNIVNTTASPDGVEKIVLAVNGSIPGPTIVADWGDTVVVHVTNSMQNNGSSIHFHGIRQNFTNQNDGVASITQCPTAPGDTTTYTWRALQYGTSWWHSHFYVQAWDGVYGGIQINGPATANYDEDLGVVSMMDWDHDTADNLVLQSAVTGPPTMANGLINGMNVYTLEDNSTVGSRYEMEFTSGQRYRLRLVNTAADTHFKFTIDNHTMEVIASDFVPIQPYTTDVVNIGIGQRYDVIVTADAPSDNYWMRAIAQLACSDNDNPDNIKAIIRYSDAANSTADPTSTATADASVDECVDEPAASLVPYLAIPAGGSADVTDNFAVAVEQLAGRVDWAMGNTTFINEWGYPSIQQVYDGNNTWGESQNVIQLPQANEWVYWIVQTTMGVTHPMHMHGHDFWVLGAGTGTFDSATASLSTVNVPRRDVTMLPASGWTVIAFITDNPGVWLTHCHIAWHTSEGLAVQMVERESEIVDLIDADLMNSTCGAWNDYANKVALVQDDSGI
uniref:laccase n=1 Tax=Cryphonectria parasitica TaxID=5116 RepID=Q3KRP1_CRYPA|nr:laccase 3 [Cryphonectria parasitica]